MNETALNPTARDAFARVNGFFYRHGVAKIDETPCPGGIVMTASSEARGDTHDFSWRVDAREGGIVAIVLKKTGLLELELRYSARTGAWRYRWDIDPEMSLNGWAGIQDRDEADLDEQDVDACLHALVESAGTMTAEAAA